MYHFHMIVSCSERSCDGSVHISDDENIVRRLFLHDLIECNHDFSYLLCYASTVDIEIDIWIRDTEIFEKGIRHILIEVLTSMDELIAYRILMSVEFSDYRCDLHEVRTSSGEEEDFYHDTFVWVRSACIFLVPSVYFSSHFFSCLSVLRFV